MTHDPQESCRWPPAALLADKSGHTRQALIHQPAARGRMKFCVFRRAGPGAAVALGALAGTGRGAARAA